MKNKINFKSNSGITLITLVITIIVLLILSSVAVYSGIEAIENTKMTTFTAELKIMQTYVNDLYEQYKAGDENVLSYGSDLDKTSQETLDKVNESYDGFRLYNSSVKEQLGIDGVNQDVLVNIQKRKIVSYLGLEYKNKMYYTLDDLPDGFYNVEYENKNTDNPETEIIDVEALGNQSYKVYINSIYNGKYINKGKVLYKLEGSSYWNESKDDYFIINEAGYYDIKFVDNAGNESEEIHTPLPVQMIPDNWQITSQKDTEWYNYGNEKVNAPKLIGKMSPIKYTAGYDDNNSVNQTNLWANAVTTDGSMWVWIPRYAYKITEGYTKKDSKEHNVDADEVIGNIEIKFIDINNNFLDGTAGKAETNPSNIKYENGTGLQQQWLVHPAFTANPENGGWDEELEGIWVAKFEATGTYDEESSTGTLSVLPGTESLRDMTVTQQYKLGKTSSFGENLSAETIGSHMAKNSEWGATAYLSYSKFGTNKAEIAQNTSSSHFTGGTDNKADIYKVNYLQSTTGNATGVYDMNGGSWEYVAGYVNWRHSATHNEYNYSDDKDPLLLYGGKSKDDLFGNSDEVRTTSTKYKTVYTEARNQ